MFLVFGCTLKNVHSISLKKTSTAAKNHPEVDTWFTRLSVIWKPQGCLHSPPRGYSACALDPGTRNPHSSSPLSEHNPCGWLTSSTLSANSKCQSPLQLTTQAALCTLLKPKPHFKSHSRLFGPLFCRSIPRRTCPRSLINNVVCVYVIPLSNWRAYDFQWSVILLLV